MDSIPGFILVPRPAGSPRPAGAFFSVEVVAPAGPGAWQVRLDGRLVTIRTELALAPGQVLRLRGVPGEPGVLTLQVLPQTGPSASGGAWAAAFLARGLPAASAALEPWKTRLSRGPQPEYWSAELAARGAVPGGPLDQGLQPWLAWEAALEQGLSDPPPEDDGFWDLWNARQPAGPSAWVVLPLKWDHEGQPGAGLLRARWSDSSRDFDFWTLAAAPAGVGFRLEVAAPPGRLDLTWRFFHDEDRRAFEALTVGWDRALTERGCRVSLRIAGTRSIDVQA